MKGQSHEPREKHSGIQYVNISLKPIRRGCAMQYQCILYIMKFWTDFFFVILIFNTNGGTRLRDLSGCDEAVKKRQYFCASIKMLAAS